MKKILITLLLVLTVVDDIYAQSGPVSGVVVDNQNAPVDFVNVVMEDAADSSFLSGTVTDAGGRFSLAVPQKKYILKLSSIGYKTKYVNPADGSLTRIALQSDEVNLKGVVVKASRPSFKVTAEGIQTNIENTVLSKAGTANDVIAHVPMIQKTQDGFTVFGKGTPKIYIDGREVQNSSELDNLKSDNIKNIELITSPGAKYDATVQSVLKIQTIRRTGDGWGFDMTSDYNQSENTDLDEKIAVTYRHKSLELFDNFKYSLENFHKKSRIWQTVYTDTLWKENNFDNEKDRSQSFENTLGFDYAFNPHNSIGAKYIVTLSPKGKDISNLSSDVTANGEYYDKLNSSVNDIAHYRPSHQLSTYFMGQEGKTSVNFNADYLFSQIRHHSATDEVSASSESRLVTSDSHVINRLLVLKLVLGHPLFGGDFDMGAQYTNTNRNDDYINPQQIVPSTFSQLKEQCIAPFVDYSKVTPVGLFTAGLRYEHSSFDYYENKDLMKDQSRKFSDFFPSFSWGIQVGQLQAQLSYTTKTTRPTYRQLSNNVTYENRFTWQSGNSLLRPEYIHDITLQGMYSWLQFNLSYNDVKHAIVYWGEQVPEDESITKISYKNLKNLKLITAALVFAPHFGYYSPQLTVGVSKQWLGLDTDMGNFNLDKPLFFGTFDNSFNFGKSMVANFQVTFQGKGNYRNVYLNKNSSTINLMMSKSLLDDRLTIQLKANDILKGQRDGNLLYNQKMQLYQLNTYDSRSIELTVSYKFNVGKSKYKGSEVGETEKSRL